MSLLHAILDDLPKFVIPLMLVAIPLYGLMKGVRVYEEFVVGAKEGFQVAVRIIPYLVAILFAIGMFRASGALDYTAQMARDYVAKAIECLEVLPASEYRDALIELSEFAVARTH